MSLPPTYSIYPVNENTVTLSVGHTIDVQTSDAVFRIYQQLRQHRPAHWLDIIPAYTTVSIVYDVLRIRHHHRPAFAWVMQEIEGILQLPPVQNPAIRSRQITIPVCYDAGFALDQKTILSNHARSWDEVVSIHTSKSYRVFMIGFLPGFAYMGTVDKAIAFPRLAKPRPNVPAGSVGIAGEQTGIYPLNSPGGWNIIGRTPVPIFDIARAQPSFFQPHDTVVFQAITPQAFYSFDHSNLNTLVHVYGSD